MRDALGAAGLPPGLADARLPGESWARLLRFVLMRVASGQRRLMISGGGNHSLVVKDGTLFSFGCGADGQLGHGDTAHQRRPKRVVALAKERVVSVAAGNSHSLALTAEGALFSFGRGAQGQLGHGDRAEQPQPKRVVVLAKERVVGVAAGGNHSLALTAEGALFSFGNGVSGQLGHGNTARQPQPKRVVALAKERVASVAAGGSHSLALTAGGALFSFGNGYFGQLGHGDTAGQWQPKRVAVLAKERVVSVAAGDGHSLVLTAEGALFSFGRGADGRLGHGDTVDQPQPKQVVAVVVL